MKNKINIKSLIPYLGLITIILVFEIGSNGGLLTFRNIKVIFSSMYIYLIAALGTSFVLAIGRMDFSIGSLVGVTATAAAMISKATENLWLCILAALAIGALSGLLISGLHVVFRLNPFIVSITFLFAFRGLTWVLNNNGSIAMPITMYKYDNYTFKVLVTLICLLLIIFLFNYTKLGRSCKAVGSGELAARQSGIAVNKVKIAAYMLSGVFAGLAGVLTLIKSGTSYTTTGNMFEVDVLIALTLGGMPLTGGSNAKIRAAILGSISLAILGNGLVMCGVNDKWQEAVKGFILLAIVAISFERSNVAVIE